MSSFSPNALVFLVYAIVAMGYAVFFAVRALGGVRKQQHTSWLLVRLFHSFASVGLSLDGVRIFLGGFWMDAYEEGIVPSGAWLIYPLLVVHLVLVPVAISTQFEYVIAVMRTQENSDRKVLLWRLFTAAVTVAFTGLGIINVTGEIQAAVQVTGLVAEEEYGLVKFTPPNITVIKENGFPGVEGSELSGVVMFSLAAIAIGVYLWRQVGYKIYFVLATVSFIGQAVGPVIPAYFFYASNFWELVSFMAMILADLKFFVSSEETSAVGFMVEDDDGDEASQDGAPYTAIDEGQGLGVKSPGFQVEL